MLRLDEVIKRLKDRNLSKIADSTGISYTVVWQIANNMQAAPKYKHIEKLSDYLEDHP